ncbi:MAG: SDR family oxidoreductase [Planctomycetales bacterium]|nr:SDR family oxidoreductase [Planctomycetales bacterium]
MDKVSVDKPKDDHTAVVTGASRGIGREIALELARHGSHVLIHAGRNATAAEQTAAEVRRLGRESVVLIQDLAATDAYETFVQAAWQWRGGVDLWVNNAGADVLTGAAIDWSFERKLAQLWAVDVEGTVHLSRRAGVRMRSAGHGCIINVGWDQADQGMGGDSGEMFATIKGAIMAFTRSLAQSLAPEVRVNCVAPGWIQTEWGSQASEYWQRRAVGESLLNRWGRPTDVARVVQFLASPQAEYVNGQVIPVNGGWRTSAARATDNG